MVYAVTTKLLKGSKKLLLKNRRALENLAVMEFIGIVLSFSKGYE